VPAHEAIKRCTAARGGPDYGGIGARDAEAITGSGGNGKPFFPQAGDQRPLAVCAPCLLPAQTKRAPDGDAGKDKPAFA
jgi:hypothetical protein